MKNIFVYLTFIPWLLHFALISKNSLRMQQKNKLSKKWLKKNFFKIFEFDKLILTGIFIYFSLLYPDANQIWLVEIMLFGVINLYLYINDFYNKNKTKQFSYNTKELIIILLISLIPIIFFSITKNQNITYYIMFAYNFFNFLIIYICKILSNLISNK